MLSWANKSSDNHSVINRIMLRFRPIAPKPVGGEATCGAEGQERANGAGSRAKRKYVRVRGRRSDKCVRRKRSEGKKPFPSENSGTECQSPPEKGPVTLQLLPERSESDRKSCSINRALEYEYRNKDRRNVEDGLGYEVAADSGAGVVKFRSAGSSTETWIIVEGVTDQLGGVGFGFSDKERVCHLERDTCPGFITDWKNTVIWGNEPYKGMVGAEKGLGACLVVKEELPRGCPSFACRVRVIQQSGHGHRWNKTVACDVWRMESAGFAWKLDVNTALSLSLS